MGAERGYNDCPTCGCEHDRYYDEPTPCARCDGKEMASLVEPRQDTPEQLLASAEEASVVLAHMDRLAPMDRKLIKRRYFDDATHRDLSKELGISPSRVAQRERNAIDQMRSMVRFEAANAEPPGRRERTCHICARITVHGGVLTPHRYGDGPIFRGKRRFGFYGWTQIERRFSEGEWPGYFCFRCVPERVCVCGCRSRFRADPQEATLRFAHPECAVRKRTLNATMCIVCGEGTSSRTWVCRKCRPTPRMTLWIAAVLYAHAHIRGGPMPRWTNRLFTRADVHSVECVDDLFEAEADAECPRRGARPSAVSPHEDGG